MTEEILSVGIDIGTSTLQLIFSKIYIENRGSSFTVPQIKIIGKEVEKKRLSQHKHRFAVRMACIEEDERAKTCKQ